MLAGIGSGNMYFKISPTREIAKMIKNCLMNFMLVLPVFSNDCRGRTGSQAARGTGLVRVPGSRRVLGSFGLPKPPGLLGLPKPRGFPGCTKRLGCAGSQAARIGATNNYILVCGFVKMKLRNSAETEKKTRSRLEKIESCADEFTRKTGICSLVISDYRWRTVLLPP